MIFRLSNRQKSSQINQERGINRFFGYLCIPKRKVETLEAFPSILKRARDLIKDEKYIYEITTSNPNKILNDIDIEMNCPEEIFGKSKFFFK